jgi:hypothetical protein
MTLLEIAELNTRFTIPDISPISGISHSILDLTPDAQNERGSIEWEILLDKKPAISEFTVPIQASNLQFFYQPPLNQELNPMNYDVLTETEAWKNGRLIVSRPENVVGSYAVYHLTKQDNEYKTGKIFHIFRPKVIDAKGTIVWASLNIINYILKIMVPQSFLDSAVYPVTIDPTFGKTSIGASEDSDSGYQIGCKYGCSETGTLTKISLYVKRASTGNMKTAVWNDNSGVPGSLFATSSEVSVGTSYSWVDFTISGSVSNANYWLGFEGNAGNLYYYKFDSGTSNQSAWRTVSYTSFPTNPFGTPDFYQARALSIYATYTTGGAVSSAKRKLLGVGR